MSVKFGVSFGSSPYGLPEPDFALGLADAVEAAGLDSLWCGDHILMHSPLLESLTTLAMFAARTKRVQIGTAVLLLALRKTAVVAKEVATIDYISEGRFILGVGVGGEYRPEWEAVGVPLKQRGRRVDEGIDVLRALWTEDAATVHGQFHDFENIPMMPKPVQAGGPPIWIGGRSDAALRRAALRGNGYMSYVVTPERFRDNLSKIHQFAAEAGRDVAGFTPAHLLFCCVDQDQEQARAQCAEYLSRTYNQDFRPLVDRYAAMGTPDQIAARVRQFVDAGVRHFILRPTVPNERLLAQVSMLAREVVPLVRESWSGAPESR